MVSNNKILLNCVMLVLGMTLLAFASVPLYRLFCATTGYGGTPQIGTKAPGATSREMIIVFNADTDRALPWEFKPGQHTLKIKVGEMSLTHYVAKNLSTEAITGRATYNVLPFAAGAYFNKVECFCFQEQTLPPGASVNMPISFYVDPAILNDPDIKNIQTITLSYTFFAVRK